MRKRPYAPCKHEPAAPPVSTPRKRTQNSHDDASIGSARPSTYRRGLSQGLLSSLQTGSAAGGVTVNSSVIDRMMPKGHVAALLEAADDDTNSEVQVIAQNVRVTTPSKLVTKREFRSPGDFGAKPRRSSIEAEDEDDWSGCEGSGDETIGEADGAGAVECYNRRLVNTTFSKSEGNSPRTPLRDFHAGICCDALCRYDPSR